MSTSVKIAPAAAKRVQNVSEPVFFILDIYLNFLRYRKKFKILYLNFLDLVEKNLETFFTEIMFWKVKNH